ncbi:SdpI family protein [Aeromicrobium senzhongii]|uniref:SdpI family protein n=1 Tax=Aeromicrobium senzhongii TaxID=2663859 RepID=A0ABX6SUL9_9ACTN|nr:SdpI family protein [Aeromicrobium senzhongii]MTB87881.1 hypothetical protein [Aeromicrobium senzhongii]QNL95099.1 SdpI family protein [Aeromicrobium senzhongii]
MSENLVARLVLSVVMLATAALLWWMARAAAGGRLRRNAIAGIRTASTMASDEAWLAAHRRAERPTLAAAGVAFLVGLAPALPVGDDALFAVVMVGSVAILALVVHGAVVGGRAARATSTD